MPVFGNERCRAWILVFGVCGWDVGSAALCQRRLLIEAAVRARGSISFVGENYAHGKPVARQLFFVDASNPDPLKDPEDGTPKKMALLLHWGT